MSIWIRSQNKLNLIDAQGFYTNRAKNKYNMCAISSHDDYFVGEYDSMEELIMVQEQIEGTIKERDWYLSRGKEQEWQYQHNFYQMPQKGFTKEKSHYISG